MGAGKSLQRLDASGVGRPGVADLQLGAHAQGVPAVQGRPGGQLDQLVEVAGEAVAEQLGLLGTSRDAEAAQQRGAADDDRAVFDEAGVGQVRGRWEFDHVHPERSERRHVGAVLLAGATRIDGRGARMGGDRLGEGCA